MDTVTQPDISQIRVELRQIISDVIRADLGDIDDETPLLDYVTSSLALLAGIRAVYDRFGVLLPIRPMFEGAANLAALATHIEEALRGRQLLSNDGSNTKEATDEEWRQIHLAASTQMAGILT